MTQTPREFSPDRRSSAFGEYALLLFGVWTCSTSVLMIKASRADPLILSGVRTLVAGLSLLPIFVFQIARDAQVERSWRPMATALSPRKLAWSLLGAALLAIHFITWTTGARLTTAANATLIVNLSPVVLPFIMAGINSERITRGEIVGTLIAMSGVIWLMGRSFNLGESTVRGDALTFGSMVLFCLYIAIGRVGGRGRTLWQYLVPLYLMTGIICLSLAALRGIAWPAFTRTEVLSLLGLGLIPTVLGHSILNRCIRTLRGQTVSTLNLLQAPFVGVMAYFIRGEVPAGRLYIAATVMLIGAIVVIRASTRRPAVPEE